MTTSLNNSCAKEFQYNDGGRLDAGFKGSARDCVARAIAIATGLPYNSVYKELASRNQLFTGSKSARNGVPRVVYETYLNELGFVWKPAPKFAWRKARTFDLPAGVCIARQARHLVAVIDGLAHDTQDTTQKMVYGYWQKD